MTQPAVRRGGDSAKHVAAAMGCLPTCWSSEDAVQEQACRYDPHVHDMSSDPYTQVSLPALALLLLPHLRTAPGVPHADVAY